MTGIIKQYRKNSKGYNQYNEPVRKEVSNLQSKILDLSYMEKMIGKVMISRRGS